MKKVFQLFVVFSLITPVNAFAFISSDSDEYTVEYNKHGAILTSEHEKYFVENDSSGHMKTTKLKLYLGVSCDAYSEIYGKGKWGKGNGGFLIKFEHKIFGFARQSIDITDGESCPDEIE